MNLDTFFEKFDLFADTPNAVAKMRELILHLAVRGKLVPQDLRDEPAIILLQKINQRRHELLSRGYPNREEAAGQIRKQSSQVLPDGLDAVPPGWQWATLMQISLLVVDCHNKTAPYAENGIRLLRTTNIRNGKLNFSDPRYVSEDIYEKWSARCKPQEGDILITREAPMGEVCIIPENMKICMGQRMMLIRLIPDFINSRFLLYSLMDPSLMDRVLDKPVGATVQHLRVGGIETLLVPLPPLAEQKRIVAKVDELMALCDRLEAQQQERETRHTALAQASLTRFADAPTPANLELLFHKSYSIEPAELRKSILTLAVQGKLVPYEVDDAVEQLLHVVEQERTWAAENLGMRVPKSTPAVDPTEIPHDIPEHWKWDRIGRLALLIEYGTSQKADASSDKIPVYRMGNIISGRLIDENMKFVEKNIEDLPALYLKTDDLLFNRTNSYELVGKTAIYKGRSDACTFASYLIRVRFPIKCLSPAFFNIAMNAPYFRNTQINPEITQQCGQANFNGTKLASTLVPVPPLPEQKRIVAKVEQLMALVDRLEAQLAESRGKAAALLEAVVAELSGVG